MNKDTVKNASVEISTMKFEIEDMKKQAEEIATMIAQINKHLVENAAIVDGEDMTIRDFYMGQAIAGLCDCQYTMPHNVDALVDLAIDIAGAAIVKRKMFIGE